MSVTHSLTDSRLVDLTDVTLAFEDANSKFVEVFTDADQDFEFEVQARLKLMLFRDSDNEVWSMFV